MNDSKKIEELNKRIDEMQEHLYKIHSLAAAICEYENSDNQDNTVSNVSDNLAELIKQESNKGIDVVAARVGI